MGSLSLFNRIFPTHGSNWRLLHCRQFFTIWATALLQNPDSALGSDEDRKSVEPVSSCFFLPPTTLQLLSPSESPVGAPTHSKPGQTEAPAQCHLPLHDTLLCCWETFTLRYIVNPGWWGPWLDWKCSCSCNQSAQPTNPAQVTLTGSATYHHQLHGEHWT